MSGIDIIDRAQWHAKPARVSSMAHQDSPLECFIHHSENGDAAHRPGFEAQARAVRAIQDFHMGPERGWSDIGYHFVVFQRSPRVFRGRASIFVPAAQLNHNTRTLAICVYGDGVEETMLQHTRFLIESICQLYPSLETIGGHRDVTATTCPGGKFYSQIPRIARAAGLKVYGH